MPAQCEVVHDGDAAAAHSGLQRRGARRLPNQMGRLAHVGVQVAVTHAASPASPASPAGARGRQCQDHQHQRRADDEAKGDVVKGQARPCKAAADQVLFGLQWREEFGRRLGRLPAVAQGKGVSKPRSALNATCACRSSRPPPLSV
jgi:hypothetical protein